jgi:hypothetical protein
VHYFIQHQVSNIQYLAAYGTNVNFKDFLIFGSGSTGLGFYEKNRRQSGAMGKHDP